ncbi:unnamed protein product [Boreogadus saida]
MCGRKTCSENPNMKIQTLEEEVPSPCGGGLKTPLRGERQRCDRAETGVERLEELTTHFEKQQSKVKLRKWTSRRLVGGQHGEEEEAEDASERVGQKALNAESKQQRLRLIVHSIPSPSAPRSSSCTFRDFPQLLPSQS